MFLNRFGSNRKGRSGMNMNNVGNKDNDPMQKPAHSKVQTAIPVKLSLEKVLKLFSIRDFFMIVPPKNSKKQSMPAKAVKAVTGLGK